MPTDAEGQFDSVNDLLTREEELHPDLAKYLFTSKGLGQVLQHPLVYSVPYIPINAHHNAQYAYKQKKAKEYRAERKWSNLIFLYERPYRMQTFLEIADEIEEHEEYWDILGNVLIDTENMYQWQEFIYEAVEPDDWQRREQRFHIMSKEELWKFSRLPATIQVYRGCRPHNKDGWSWTISKEVAKGFATRYGMKGQILSGTVAKDHVVAFFDRRGEEEILVDPMHVRLKSTAGERED